MYYKMHQSRLVSSNQSEHLLQGVGSAGDGLPAGVALAPCPGVVGDPLVVTALADDVALHEDQIQKCEELTAIFRTHLTTLVQTHGTPHNLGTHRTFQNSTGV